MQWFDKHARNQSSWHKTPLYEIIINHTERKPENLNQQKTVKMNNFYLIPEATLTSSHAAHLGFKFSAWCLPQNNLPSYTRSRKERRFIIYTKNFTVNYSYKEAYLRWVELDLSKHTAFDNKLRRPARLFFFVIAATYYAWIES